MKTCYRRMLATTEIAITGRLNSKHTRLPEEELPLAELQIYAFILNGI